METIEEIKTDEIIVNFEPEFKENDNEEVSAQYFVLIENSQNINDDVYESKILGVPVSSWVERACKTKPVLLGFSEEDNVIELIRPYLNGSVYSVVLFANTPLVSKQHLNDLLAFVERKNMSVCKLKRGFVFKNEYISRMDEFFSIDSYNFASDDFFEVNSISDVKVAEEILKNRLFDFYEKNGVNFENRATISIDAISEIGYASTIFGGSRVLLNSKLGTNVQVGANSNISNSKLNEDVEIGIGTIVDGSIVKTGAKIGDGVILKGSIVGEGAVVKAGSKIIGSAIGNDAIVGCVSAIVGSKIGDSTIVGDCVTAVKSQSKFGAKIKDGERVFGMIVESEINSQNEE